MPHYRNSAALRSFFEGAGHMLGAVVVDVVSDVVCPWCYIGKRRLEAAIAQLRESDPDLPFTIRWHPFQLNPDLPPEGVDRKAYLEAKFGGPERAKQVYERVTAAGRSASAFRSTSTRSGASPTRSTRIVSSPGRSRATRATPTRWSRACSARTSSKGAMSAHRRAREARGGRGLRSASTRARFLESDALKDVVADRDRRARDMGIGGVPFFIFDGKTALSGAHEPATILEAIRQARAAA